MNQNSKYITDVAYPLYFYKEIQPLWLCTIVKFLGLIPPNDENFTYCELGCGAGLNLIIAATFNQKSKFIGMDFNEKHINYAKNAVKQIGLKNIEFLHVDFEKFLKSTNLKFDFIVCHGVWSWISKKEQKNILDIAAKTLKSKGLFYLHYMCHPGSTHTLELQKLLNILSLHTDGNSAAKIEYAFGKLKEIAKSGIFLNRVGFDEYLKKLESKTANYLAHEFLTDNWSVEHSVDIHSIVAQTGAIYIGSANIFENIDDSLSIPAQMQQSVSDVSSIILKEMLKDLARNQANRMDLFQKEPKMPDKEKRLSQIDDVCFKLLSNPVTKEGAKFNTPIGEINAPLELLNPVIDRLKQKATTFGRLKQLPIFTNNMRVLFQTIELLIMQGNIHVSKNILYEKSKELHELTKWIDKNRISIQIIPECQTAIIL
ncbi:MAG: methyltransferase domain-containing protein [Campylobacteraceae bacterium]|nr:methyltransferase domain-containing protein [Campylobacteraceae bacterium]